MDVPLPTALLEKVALFRDLDPTALAPVLDAATIREQPAGGVFFRQGEAADAFYVLLAGRVKVTQVTADGQKVVVRFAGPGEMLGCVALVSGADYPGSTEVTEDARALCWDARTCYALMERFPRLALNALGIAGRHLRACQERCRELATERVERRIARAILRLAHEAGRAVDAGVLIEFGLSRQDVAELTGTTLYTVSRTLSAWEKQDLVELGRERVVLRDPAGLLRIAEDAV
jgi:CRP/FNR family transcriptional regulator, nitrogen oxide reductase regulator